MRAWPAALISTETLEDVVLVFVICLFVAAVAVDFRLRRRR